MYCIFVKVSSCLFCGFFFVYLLYKRTLAQQRMSSVICGRESIPYPQHYLYHTSHRSRCQPVLVSTWTTMIRFLFDPWIRDLVWVKNKNSGSGMNNPDHISEGLETIFWLKIHKFFDAKPGSGMEKIRIRDGKNLDPG